MQLSSNLNLSEVTKSNTAIKNGIDNSPTDTHLVALQRIAKNIFQPLREHFGKPLFISSGYRSPELNKKVGGSSESQHCHGEALDIDADMTDGLTNKELFLYIKTHLDYDKLIWEFGNESEPNWVHVSHRDGENRKQAMVAYKDDNNKTKYKMYE